MHGSLYHSLGDRYRPRKRVWFPAILSDPIQLYLSKAPKNLPMKTLTSNLSDRQLQELMYELQQSQERHIRWISNIVTFYVVISIAGAAIWFFVLK